MQPNIGELPRECRILDEAGEVTGYRAVRIKLFNGMVVGPWPSKGGRGGDTKWAISRPKPHPFQIEFWELA